MIGLALRPIFSRPNIVALILPVLLVTPPSGKFWSISIPILTANRSKFREQVAEEETKKMSIVLNCAASVSPACATRKWKATVFGKQLPSRTSTFSALVKPTGFRVNAFFFNPIQEPILKDALKEPVAFAGGIFAGLLRLDLNEDPLKEWVARTVEASGITAEEIEASDDQAEDIPQQIEIE
ncbi:PREDICTED: uncharacterized protein LOC109216095 [Nicotiana attenuata]|nr:PREDICTED: uncharacterized protein LOC109216095 [Nicotiana attenuata]